MMQINILLMGKSGVGKSSFINYIFNHNIAKSGAGLPITQGIEKYKLQINGIDVEFSDTKGLEAETSTQIKKQLLNEIKNRDKYDFNNRYHIIFYCISMNNPRLDNFEIAFIKNVMENINQPANIILTHCDNKSENEIEKMKLHISNSLGNNMSVYEVCNVNETKRNGKKAIQFGKEKIAESIFDQAWSDACYTIAFESISENLDNIKYYLKNIKGFCEAECNKKEHLFAKLSYKKQLDKYYEIAKNLPPKDMKQTYLMEIKNIENRFKTFKISILTYYKLLGVTECETMFSNIFSNMYNTLLNKFDYNNLGISKKLSEELDIWYKKIEFIFSGKRMFIEKINSTLDNIYSEMKNQKDSDIEKMKQELIDLSNKFRNKNQEINNLSN